MCPDREPMCLVTQPLQIEKHGALRFQTERRAALHKKALPPSLAIGALGAADHWDARDVNPCQPQAHHAELTKTAGDQHQIRKAAPPAVALIVAGFLVEDWRVRFR